MEGDTCTCHRSIFIDTYITKDWLQLHTWVVPVGFCVWGFFCESEGVMCMSLNLCSGAGMATRPFVFLCLPPSHWDRGHLSDAIQEGVATGSVAYHILSSYIKRHSK